MPLPNRLALMASAAILAASTSLHAQAAWQYTQESDPLRAKMSDRFELKGTYLTPPRNSSTGSSPSLVVVCVDGKVQENYFAVHAVLDVNEQSIFPVMMDARLDGKSTTIGGDRVSSDGTAVYFIRSDLAHVIEGHLLIVGAEEYLGPKIVMQFDIPDPAPLFDRCSADRMLKHGRKH
jgi:hypothetical protein